MIVIFFLPIFIRFGTIRCIGNGCGITPSPAFIPERGIMIFKKTIVPTLVTNALFLLECHELDN